ncbi:hypothetical protein [Virgibacillus sp. LDC-1]|uniref:hypothetical protein n=1 Tax=Virgibacillus sp. LDC-1 TaxID=3039856 RepID=UPI0024DEA8D4|nr:hypothetical protein [Virgibacillus sp. LDC-1]
MQLKQPMITRAYHFISEMIIIFLCFLPILHYGYQWIPFWSYLFCLVGIMIIYSLYSTYFDTYAIYIVTTPVIMLCFYFLSYPLLWSIVFPILFTWRFIKLRNEAYLENEMLYIKIIFCEAIILLMWLQYMEIAIFTGLTLILLVSGYWGGHIKADRSTKEQLLSTRIGWLILLILSVVGGLFLFLYGFGVPIIDKALEGFIMVIAWIASIPFRILDAFGIELKPLKEPEIPIESSNADQITEEMIMNENASDKGNWLDFFYATLLGLIIVFLLFSVVKAVRKRFRSERLAAEGGVIVTYEAEATSTSAKKRNGRLKKLWEQYRIHPVRKMIVDFERKAINHRRGRKAYETLEEWFNRIGVSIDTDTYQKVRYGEKDVSKAEMTALKKQLIDGEALLK